MSRGIFPGKAQDCGHKSSISEGLNRTMRTFFFILRHSEFLLNIKRFRKSRLRSHAQIFYEFRQRYRKYSIDLWNILHLYDSCFMTYESWILCFEVRLIKQIQDSVEIEYSSNSDHILTNPELHLIPHQYSECQNRHSSIPSGEW